MLKKGVDLHLQGWNHVHVVMVMVAQVVEHVTRIAAVAIVVMVVQPPTIAPVLCVVMEPDVQQMPHRPVKMVVKVVKKKRKP